MAKMNYKITQKGFIKYQNEAGIWNRLKGWKIKYYDGKWHVEKRINKGSIISASWDFPTQDKAMQWALQYRFAE